MSLDDIDPKTPGYVVIVLEQLKKHSILIEICFFFFVLIADINFPKTKPNFLFHMNRHQSITIVHVHRPQTTNEREIATLREMIHQTRPTIDRSTKSSTKIKKTAAQLKWTLIN